MRIRPSKENRRLLKEIRRIDGKLYSRELKSGHLDTPWCSPSTDSWPDHIGQIIFLLLFSWIFIPFVLWGIIILPRTIKRHRAYIFQPTNALEEQLSKLQFMLNKGGI